MSDPGKRKRALPAITAGRAAHARLVVEYARNRRLSVGWFRFLRQTQHHFANNVALHL